jgi:hypothetical protein
LNASALQQQAERCLCGRWLRLDEQKISAIFDLRIGFNARHE